MDFENKYPYTDFHELNLDWILKQMKKLAEDWDAYQEALTGTNGAWPTFKSYIESSWATYQANLTGPTGEWPTFKAAMEQAWNNYQESLTGTNGEWPTFKATMESEWQQFFDTYLQTLGVLQNTGSSETMVMSQKTVTDYIISPNLVNLDDPDIEKNGYYDRQNVWHSDVSWMESGYIPCNPGDVLYNRKETEQSTFNNTPVLCYNANKEYIAGIYQASLPTLTVPANTYFIRIPLSVSAYKTCISYKQLDEYVPYYNLHTVKKQADGIGYGYEEYENNGTAQSSTAQYFIYCDEPTYVHSIIQYFTNTGTFTYQMVEAAEDFAPNVNVTLSEAITVDVGDEIIIDDTLSKRKGISFYNFSRTNRWYLTSKTAASIKTLTFGAINTDHVDNIYPTTAPSGLIKIGHYERQYYNKQETNELFVKKGESIPTHWNGKTCYAYGTSITSVSQGAYVPYLAQLSGLNIVNKGIAGGGIGNLGGYSHGQVYNAICNITDGKLNADLITLETGANDTGAAVPYGTIYDTGTATLAGCLNDCLRYLQANTKAQIVVMYSPSTTTLPNAADKYWEWKQMVKEICAINNVWYIENNNNMGYGKLTSASGSDYVRDNIHQTDLGGYNQAQTIWAQLKNIPLFYSVMP